MFFELVGNDKIYYSSNLNLEPGSTGQKKIIISRIRTCPEDTELELLLLVYRRSDLSYRIFRLTDESFVC